MEYKEGAGQTEVAFSAFIIYRCLEHRMDRTNPGLLPFPWAARCTCTGRITISTVALVSLSDTYLWLKDHQPLLSLSPLSHHNFEYIWKNVPVLNWGRGGLLDPAYECSPWSGSYKWLLWLTAGGCRWIKHLTVWRLCPSVNEKSFFFFYWRTQLNHWNISL